MPVDAIINHPNWYENFGIMDFDIAGQQTDEPALNNDDSFILVRNQDHIQVLPAASLKNIDQNLSPNATYDVLTPQLVEYLLNDCANSLSSYDFKLLHEIWKSYQLYQCQQGH
ncbi:hypothetical protein RF11_03561 [Thelohanellus kitauei]|uniref:Uncharacterized protein n=1 Tax=Thelohanellus kitauei TaxID=669202 RepID=A0A0C2MTG8_THEKT|nr:hypothetical protein RF11_03561 [Thelohanellus kitauei]